MFCKNCGFRLDKNALFCENCGIKIVENNSSVSKSKLVAILLYLFFNFLCIGDLYLGYTKKFKKQMIRLFILFITLPIIVVVFDDYLLIIFLSFFVIIYIIIFIGIIGVIKIITGIRILIGNIKTDANGIVLK